ncbi:MAG: ABC transporter permease [Acidobacteriota bacterium]
MSKTRPQNSGTDRLRLLSWLLLALPTGFRQAWGRDILVSFQESLQEIHLREGASGVRRLWRRTVVDLIKTALAERLWPSCSSPDPKPPSKERNVMKNLRLDLLCALRSLRRKPGLALVAVLTLALGSGLTIGMLSLAEAVFLQALPYPDSDRLLRVYEVSQKRGAALAPTSYLNYRDWRENSPSFQEMALVRLTPDTTLVLESQGQVNRLQAALVSASYFPILGVEAALGRTFSPQEDQSPQGAPVVILSHGLWSGRLGSDPGMVGKPIQLGGQPVTVVGVLPEGFHDPSSSAAQTDIWLPSMMAPQVLVPDILESRHKKYFDVLARLKPEATLHQARQEMEALAQELARKYPDANRDWTYLLRPLREDAFSQVRLGALVLLAAAGLVLGIVCVNLANLLLVDASGRQAEFAMRMALGAPRRRLLSLLLGESLALTAAGGLAGLLTAWASLDFFLSSNPFALPSLVQVQIDASVLAVSLSVIALGGLVAGLAPALAGTRLDLREALTQSGRQGSFGSHRSSRLLVVAEVAIAVVVLVGAGLVLRSFQQLRQTGLGFDSQGMLTLYLDLSLPRYASQPARIQLSQELMRRTASLPGARSVDLWGPSVPGHDSDYMSVAAEHSAGDSADQVFLARYNCVTASGLDNLGLTALQGRPLSEADRFDAPAVVMISRSLAQALWPGQEAVGKRLRWVFDPNPDPWASVVGLVEDAWTGGRLGANSRNHMDIYFPMLQFTPRQLGIVLRADGGSLESLAAAAREAVRQVDPGIAVYDVASVDQIMAREEGPTRFTSFLMSAFAALTTFLALLGIYGVLARSAERRTQEVGIRYALGARPARLRAMLMGEGVKLSLAATLLGLLSAAWLVQWMESLLFGISPFDPWVFAGVGLLMLTVSLLACYLPARRFTRSDPAAALRGL